MHRRTYIEKPEEQPFLEMRDVDIATPEGRLLFKDLNMVLGKEKVAVIGRNGVGKTTLLNILAGLAEPISGEVKCRETPYHVPQEPDPAAFEIPDSVSERELAEIGLTAFPDSGELKTLSMGSLRKVFLLAAMLRLPKMLLLDEPTEDLDEEGIKWLISKLKSWRAGLVVVSHDRNLLSLFEHFFIISESGCRYFSGSFTELSFNLEKEAENAEKRYIMKLHSLERKEAHRLKVLNRRQRKKNFGRISELQRCTPRSRLNKKRSQAQVSQGKAAGLAQNRIDEFRTRLFSGRRSLAVTLGLSAFVPEFKRHHDEILFRLNNLSGGFEGRALFSELELSLCCERFAITGPNGAGKTTLLNLIRGDAKPLDGSVTQQCRFGAVAQGGSDWIKEESLLELLLIYSDSVTPDDVAILLKSHGFPFALADRPLSSLSPGERVRAALICLFTQVPSVDALILDEPTYSLDFVGETSLRKVLKAWPGGLIVSSHNREFLSSIGIAKELQLDGEGGKVIRN